MYIGRPLALAIGSESMTSSTSRRLAAGGVNQPEVQHRIEERAPPGAHHSHLQDAQLPIKGARTAS